MAVLLGQIGHAALCQSLSLYPPLPACQELARMVSGAGGRGSGRAGCEPSSAGASPSRSRIGAYTCQEVAPEPDALSQPASANADSRSALAMGPKRVWPSVPSQRGAWARSVANTNCTTSTAPTKP